MTLTIPNRAGGGPVPASLPPVEGASDTAPDPSLLVSGWRRIRRAGLSRAADTDPTPTADAVGAALAAVAAQRAMVADLDAAIEADGAGPAAPPWSAGTGGLALAAATAAALPGGWAVAATVTGGAAAAFLAAGLAVFLVATARAAGRLGRSTLAGRLPRVRGWGLAALAVGQAGLVALLPAMAGTGPGGTVLGLAALGLALAAGVLTTAGDPHTARLLEHRAAAVQDLATAERHAQTLLDRAHHRLADQLTRLEDQRAALAAEAKETGPDAAGAGALPGPRWRVIVARLTTLVT